MNFAVGSWVFTNRSVGMVLGHPLHLPLLLLIHTIFPGWAALLLGGFCAFLLAYGLAFGVRAFCHKMDWLDRPAERRVHKIPLPRLGGIAIYLAFAITSLL